MLRWSNNVAAVPLLAGAGLALALTGCADPAGTNTVAKSTAAQTSPALAPMDTKLVRALYSQPHREDGVVLQGDHAGTHWVKWAKPDGSLKLSAAHGLFTDTGHYELRGNQVCFVWKTIDDGKTSCMNVAKIGENEYATLMPNGTEMSAFRVSQSGAGAPSGLVSQQ